MGAILSGILLTISSQGCGLRATCGAGKSAMRGFGLALLLSLSAAASAQDRASDFLAQGEPPATHRGYSRFAAFAPAQDGTRLAVTWYLAPRRGRRALPGIAVVSPRPPREHRSGNWHDPPDHGRRGHRLLHRAGLRSGSRRDARQRRLVRQPRAGSRAADRARRPGCGRLDRAAGVVIGQSRHDRCELSGLLAICRSNWSPPPTGPALRCIPG